MWRPGYSIHIYALLLGHLVKGDEPGGVALQTGAISRRNRAIAAASVAGVRNRADRDGLKE